MRIFPALAVSVAAVAATVVCSVALAGDQASGSSPTGLKGFVLKSDEAVTHTFSQTPSFSWTPVRGASSYEVQLAKSASFSDQSVFWSGSAKTPTLASPLALPWMTGFPYAAYVRVRAIRSSSPSDWSAPFGFNLRWSNLPQQLPDLPGLSRWTQVPGATGYQVWFVGVKTGIRTRTDSIDHREYYLDNSNGKFSVASGVPSGQVRWRVRAERILYGAVPNGVPRASYGPWSPTYASNDSQLAAGTFSVVSSVTSDAQSTAAKALSHDLTPGLTYSGYEPSHFFRTYVSTDEDCVNTVYAGSISASPASAPRLAGADPILVIKDGVAKWGKPDEDRMADGTVFTPSEFLSAASLSGTTDPTDSSSTPSSSGAGASSGSGSSTNDQPADPLVDLWESGWPTGRYYWTVVPVTVFMTPDEKIIAQDLEQPQDACQSGRVLTFGRETAPVVASTGSPFASGLSTTGRLTAAVSGTPTFYGSPLVAWKPVGIATQYQIEWSKSQYPWKKSGSTQTTATAASLPLAPGTWWYRVRGVANFLPGTAKLMSWSTPLRIQVAAPKFTIAR